MNNNKCSSSEFNWKRMKKFRLFSVIRRNYRLGLLLLLVFVGVHYSGLVLYLSQCELDNVDYVHPVNHPKLTNYVNFYHERYVNFSTLDQLKAEANRKFEYKTLDENFNERFLIENANKCRNKAGEFDDVRLLILIKSALANRKQRDLIRKSWSDERRFSDVRLRTLFSVGSCEAQSDEAIAKLDIKQTKQSCQDLIDDENELNGDLIQIDFIDSYYNNTIKTMNGIKWIVKHCPTAEFVLLIDDDYYLSVKNLLRHLRWLNYGDDEKRKIMKQMTYMKSNYEKSLINEMKPKFDPYAEHLYAGWVFNSSVPCRYRLSKWFINLDEYPFSRWPSYVTAGFVLLSNRSFKSIYFASLYTKPFRFDDIYLSILTRKVDIQPLHNSNVYFYKRDYSDDGLEYMNTIGSHGFKNGHEMLNLWILMKSKGFA